MRSKYMYHFNNNNKKNGQIKIQNRYRYTCWVNLLIGKSEGLAQEDQPSFVSNQVSTLDLSTGLQMPSGFLDPELVDLSEILLKMPFSNDLVQKFSDMLTENGKDISEMKRNYLVECLDEMIGDFV